MDTKEETYIEGEYTVYLKNPIPVGTRIRVAIGVQSQRLTPGDTGIIRGYWTNRGYDVLDTERAEAVPFPYLVELDGKTNFQRPSGLWLLGPKDMVIVEEVAA